MENEQNKQVNIRKIVIPAVLGILLLFVGYKVWNYLRHEETDNAQVEMRLVPILSRVSGYVDKILVEDYATVKKGQLLMVIDTTELHLQLAEMEADYNQAIADLANAQASLTNAEAALSSTRGQADVTSLRKEKATNDFTRDKELFESNAITKKQFDDSKSNYDITIKQLETSFRDVKVAETRLGILKSQVSKAQAQVDVKKARLDQQKLKISYCYIYAPSDGTIGKRNVDQGQFIQPGAPVFTQVNGQELWVVANFKESQIKNIRDGKEVDIVVDGFPQYTIKGKVTSISGATGAKFSLLPPDNATGNFIKVTQRIPVRIEILELEKYRSILRAGMSVDVTLLAD
ncbi:MAG: HlyD family secretion protein [Ignavibacteria bacterium]|nr:HlyD family secretion protein [Ignavibacteria bacterium]